jgi:diacylglycerol kinase
LRRSGRFVKGRLVSFVPAFAGWAHVLRTQPNAWVHAAVTIAVVALALWLRVERVEWLALLLAIGLVWVTEFFNTALEAVVDLASPRQHRLAKAAKDVAAGAVVVAALIAALVGLLVLWPPLWARLS